MIKIKNAKQKREESYRSIIKDVLLDVFITDEERRRKGDHLGIFIYVALWFFGVLVFAFSTSSYIKSGMIFYLYYDVVAIFFVILFFMNERHLINIGEIEQGERFFVFPNIKDSVMTVIFVLILFAIVVLISSLLEPFFLKLVIHEDIFISFFDILRVVPVEEMAFRGMGFFITIYLLTYMFNPEGNKLIMKKKNKTKFEVVDKRIWIFTIIVIGILFGMYHFFKFYNPYTFPYVYLNIYGTITKTHIFYPLFYISFLGIALGICRMKYGLTGSMFMHLINNLVSSAILYAIYFGGVL